MTTLRRRIWDFLDGRELRSSTVAKQFDITHDHAILHLKDMTRNGNVTYRFADWRTRLYSTIPNSPPPGRGIYVRAPKVACIPKQKSRIGRPLELAPLVRI